MLVFLLAGLATHAVQTTQTARLITAGRLNDSISSLFLATPVLATGAILLAIATRRVTTFVLRSAQITLASQLGLELRIASIFARALLCAQMARKSAASRDRRASLRTYAFGRALGTRVVATIGGVSNQRGSKTLQVVIIGGRCDYIAHYAYTGATWWRSAIVDVQRCNQIGARTTLAAKPCTVSVRVVLLVMVRPGYPVHAVTTSSLTCHGSTAKN